MIYELVLAETDACSFYKHPWYHLRCRFPPSALFLLPETVHEVIPMFKNETFPAGSPSQIKGLISEHSQCGCLQTFTRMVLTYQRKQLQPMGHNFGLFKACQNLTEIALWVKPMGTGLYTKRLLVEEVAAKLELRKICDLLPKLRTIVILVRIREEKDYFKIVKAIWNVAEASSLQVYNIRIFWETRAE